MDELHELLADLVAIDSVNPSLVPGGAGEAAIARFVAAWLQAEGLEVHIEEVAPGARTWSAWRAAPAAAARCS